MSDNPWNVSSLQEFWYLKCPECFFDTQEEDIFQLHAIENHPLSEWLFGVPKKDLKKELKDSKEPKIKEEPTDENYENEDYGDDNSYDQGYT